MARMVPPTPVTDTRSRAELKLFERIRTQLSEDWIGLHSLGVGSHPYKPWAEIDFVLIGPPGVFCLEVKGGRVARDDDGTWLFTDGNGQTSAKQRGPWEQVGPASVAIHEFLGHEDKDLKRALVGYGVVMPDIEFTQTGPDIMPEVLYDQRDHDGGLSRYVERLSDYWIGRFGQTWHGQARSLDEAARSRVLSLLRGRFDRRPSLRWAVRQADEELLRLTEEQYGVLDALADNERTLVQGGAGTGKTLLAVEEARRRASTSARVLYVCFNARLAGWLTSQPGLDGVTVKHLHGLMREVVRDAGYERRIPGDAGIDDVSTVFLPAAFLEAVLDGAGGPAFDFIVVDEAQDLMSEAYLDALDASLEGGLLRGRWCVFYDPKQDVYAGMRPHGLSRLTDASPARYRLTKNCRNTVAIAVATALLSGIAADETSRAEGPEVTYIWCRDGADQHRKVSNEIRRLLGEHLESSQITVLGPRRLENSAFADRVDLGFCRLSDKLAADGRAVHYATIPSFKGLESDAVILVDVDELHSEESARRLYTAASRARAYLAVLISETARDDYAARAREYGQRMVSRDA